MVQTQIVAVGLNVVSLLLAVIAIAIPYWMDIEGLINSGLWSMCVNGVCRSFTEIANIIPGSYLSDALKAVQAMELLGMIGLIVSLVCGILKASVMKNQSMLRLLAAGLAIFAGVFLLIGAIIFAADPDNQIGVQAKYLHAGFALAIIASVFSIATGGVYVKARDLD